MQGKLQSKGITSKSKLKNKKKFITNHQTKLGKYIVGDSIKLLQESYGQKLKGKVQLILTSPPFPLNAKKKYGNLQGNDYLNWFSSLVEQIQLAFVLSDLNVNGLLLRYLKNMPCIQVFVLKV